MCTTVKNIYPLSTETFYFVYKLPINIKFKVMFIKKTRNVSILAQGVANILSYDVASLLSGIKENKFPKDVIVYAQSLLGHRQNDKLLVQLGVE